MSEQDYWDRMNSVRELKHAMERIAELEAALRFIQRTTEEHGTREVASEALAAPELERE